MDEKQKQVHRLPSGREVYLVRLAIRPTYEGVLEGSAADVSRYILKRLPEIAKMVMPPAKPLAIISSPQFPLPAWLCVAELDSRQGVRQTDPDFNSRLFVCWFLEDTATSIDAMVESILPHLEWDRLAEDYDIMDF